MLFVRLVEYNNSYKVFGVVGGMKGERVAVESPFKGRNWGHTERNLAYARRCVRDCHLRGEYPIASHLLSTQDGILDDKSPEERAIGIRAGLRWGELADRTVVYVDYGISGGMRQGIFEARCLGRKVEIRSLKKLSWGNGESERRNFMRERMIDIYDW